MMADREIEDVKAFHQKFGMIVSDTPGHLTIRKLLERIECMREELSEFEAAVHMQDLAAQFDALLDLVYFAKGTAVQLGLPWEDGWDEVQRANMDKVRGVTKRGHAVDCVKPDGWRAPDHAPALEAAGYCREDWEHTVCRIDETRCRDDSVVDK